jgi:hypothetical protein
MKKIEEIPTCIRLKLDTFEREANDLGIYNLNEFYTTREFRAKHEVKEKEIFCKL